MHPLVVIGLVVAAIGFMAPQKKAESRTTVVIPPIADDEDKEEKPAPATVVPSEAPTSDGGLE